MVSDLQWSVVRVSVPQTAASGQQPYVVNSDQLVISGQWLLVSSQRTAETGNWSVVHDPVFSRKHSELGIWWKQSLVIDGQWFEVNGH